MSINTRMGDWKLQKMPPPSGDGRWHLCNLADDLGETRDVQRDYPEIFTELEKDYAAYATEVGIAELGPDYNPSQQVALGFARSLLGFLLPYALGILLAITIAAIFGARAIRSR